MSLYVIHAIYVKSFNQIWVIFWTKVEIYAEKPRWAVSMRQLVDFLVCVEGNIALVHMILEGDSDGVETLASVTKPRPRQWGLETELRQRQYDARCQSEKCNDI